MTTSTRTSGPPSTTGRARAFPGLEPRSVLDTESRYTDTSLDYTREKSFDPQFNVSTICVWIQDDSRALPLSS